MANFDIEPAQEVRANKKYSMQKADDIYQLLLAWTKDRIGKDLVVDINKILEKAIGELTTARQANFDSISSANEIITADLKEKFSKLTNK